MKWRVRMGGVGLVGRAGELELLTERIRDLQAGRGGVVWVEGEAGIGKSALLQDAWLHVQDLGLPGMRAVGDELTPSLSLRALAAGIAGDRGNEMTNEIARLLETAGGFDAVLTATERIIDCIQQACVRRPTVLIADDVQWLDDASLVVLRHLCRSTELCPLLLLLAGRRVPRRDMVERLRSTVDRNPDAVRIELEPLDVLAINEIARRRLGAEPDPVLLASLRSAGGNPLFALTILDAAGSTHPGGPVESGPTAVAAQAPEPVAGAALPSAVPSPVAAAVRRRMGFLDDEVTAALRVAAVLGPTFTLSELARMSDQPIPRLARLLDTAIRDGVLLNVGAEFSFRHPLVRRVLYEEVAPGIRAGLHEHAAATLANTGASWQRVARHLLAAPDIIDGWVLTWIDELPSTATQMLPEVGAELLERARRVMVPGDPRRDRATARLAGALHLQRRAADLVQLATGSPLSTVSDPAAAGEFAWYLARAYQVLPGQVATGLAQIDVFLRERDPGPPWRSRLLAQRAVLTAVGGQVDEARAAIAEALAVSERDGDPVGTGWALFAEVLLAGLPDAMELVDRALALPLPDDPDSVDLRLSFLAQRLAVLTLVGDLRFDKLLPATLAEVERSGSPRLIEVQIVAALAFIKRGDWERSLLYLAQVEPLTPTQELFRSGISALIHTHRDERGLAEEFLAMTAGVDYTASIDLLHAARALIFAKAANAEINCDLAGAIDVLSVWLDPRVGEYSRGRLSRGYDLFMIVRAALAADRPTIARQAADLAAADARRDGNPDQVVLAGACTAMVEGDPAALLAAEDHYAASQRPVEGANFAEEAAVRLAARGLDAEARAALARAANVYHDVGDVIDLRRAQARLRPYGIRVGSRALRRRPKDGWDALTEAELAVTALVAEGLSNPEIATRLFVSRRTVDTHVGRLLQKLGLRSRIDVRLAFQARRAGTAPNPSGTAMSATPDSPLIAASAVEKAVT